MMINIAALRTGELQWAELQGEKQLINGNWICLTVHLHPKLFGLHLYDSHISKPVHLHPPLIEVS
jgi:hypothetical protein